MRNDYVVVNHDKHGNLIEDISRITINHDDMPDVWQAVATLARLKEDTNEQAMAV